MKKNDLFMEVVPASGKRGKGTSKEKLYKTTEERSRVVLIGYKLTEEM